MRTSWASGQGLLHIPHCGTHGTRRDMLAAPGRTRGALGGGTSPPAAPGQYYLVKSSNCLLSPACVVLGKDGSSTLSSQESFSLPSLGLRVPDMHPNMDNCPWSLAMPPPRQQGQRITFLLTTLTCLVLKQLFVLGDVWSITGMNVATSRTCGQKAWGWGETFAPFLALELFYTSFTSVNLRV